MPPDTLNASIACESTSSVRRSWRAWVIGPFEVLFAMALIVWLLTLPALFDWYYPALRVSPHPNDASQVVRWLAGNKVERALYLATVDGKLRAKELRHFSDVRRVFRNLPQVVAGLGLVLFIAALALRPSRQELARAQVSGLTFWAVLLLTVGGLAWWNWALFFAWVHHPFFGDTSWRLPDNCYSLQLFPGWFWRVMAATVLLTPAAALACLAWLLRPRQKVLST